MLTLKCSIENAGSAHVIVFLTNPVVDQFDFQPHFITIIGYRPWLERLFCSTILSRYILLLK